MSGGNWSRLRRDGTELLEKGPLNSIWHSANGVLEKFPSWVEFGVRYQFFVVEAYRHVKT